MRGWIPGYPRKFGAVHQTRTFAAASPASAPLAHDSRFTACMSAHDRLLVQARVTLRERVERLVGLLDRRIVGRRYFPRLSAGMHDKPAVDGRGGAQFCGGLWRRVGSAGAAEGGARISILVFLFRHRYRDPGKPDRLAISVDANKRVWFAAGINKSTHFNQINLWLVR